MRKSMKKIVQRTKMMEKSRRKRNEDKEVTKINTEKFKSGLKIQIEEKAKK